MLDIKDLLRRKGITQKELAEKLNMSAPALSLSLAGNPTLDRIISIANALNVEVSELFAPPTSGVITCPHCGKQIALNPSEL